MPFKKKEGNISKKKKNTTDSSQKNKRTRNNHVSDRQRTENQNQRNFIRNHFIGRQRNIERVRIDIPRRLVTPQYFWRLSVFEFISPSILFSLLHWIDVENDFHQIIFFISDGLKKNVVSDLELKNIKLRAHTGNPNITCSICLSDVRIKERIRVLPCDHEFHSKCVDKWLRKQENCCPICRKEVIPRRTYDDNIPNQT
ncbi:putative E3 ubiquitin ligase [Pseudoloma neurophilia]|uniref:Putative E3 ubiquitin ligase n=1 Tax=Pseudoloma neurophilia TaxID=146866 RepID=A0A0R0M142_9MICR|nr:putative E3 ubiquitin ligase [Pseudoloma neurophilia]